jgi:hypothetical protein
MITPEPYSNRSRPIVERIETDGVAEASEDGSVGEMQKRLATQTASQLQEGLQQPPGGSREAFSAPSHLGR